jgi:Ser/Thr protein kinase RdoA (MazF antagonist)
VDIAQLASRVLAEAYGVPGSRLRQLPAGLSTVNFAADSAAAEPLFVKVYRPGADLVAARAAIELSRFAGSGDVPTANVLSDNAGALIHVRPNISLSVWSFVDGETGDTVPLSAARMVAIGDLLGRLHRRLAAFAGPAARRDRWCDVALARDALEVMIARVRHASHLDKAMRAWAADVLQWRLDRLPLVEATLRLLPAPSVQVVHGDVNAGNIIFRGERVAALVDFDPPAKRPVWWEIGRIGCSQDAILADDHWLVRLGRLLLAYREQHGRMPVQDLVAVPRAARCFMTASVTPFDDLIDPGAVVADPDGPLSMQSLTRFAVARHAAVVALWEDAEDRDQMLHGMLL